MTNKKTNNIIKAKKCFFGKLLINETNESKNAFRRIKKVIYRTQELK